MCLFSALIYILLSHSKVVLDLSQVTSSLTVRLGPVSPASSWLVPPLQKLVHVAVSSALPSASQAPVDYAEIWRAAPQKSMPSWTHLARATRALLHCLEALCIALHLILVIVLVLVSNLGRPQAPDLCSETTTSQLEDSSMRVA